MEEITKARLEELSSPGIERKILSLICKSSDVMAECDNKGITVEHFKVEANKYIYMAIKYMYEINQVPEPLAIMEIIVDGKAKKTVEDMGGINYLLALQKNPIIDKNIEIYANKLKQTHIRNILYRMSDIVQKEMLADASKVLNIEELVGLVQSKLDDIGVTASEANEVYKMGLNVEDRLAKYAENPMPIPGLECGFYMFDMLTGGMKGADLLFICARSKVGKSVMLTNIANKIAIHDRLPILYIDTEMPSEQVEDRLLSMNSGVPEKEIQSGMFTRDTEYGTAEDKIERLKKASALIKEGCLHHVFLPNYTVQKIETLTRKYYNKYGIVALIFDYLKMPQTSKGTLKHSQEYQELGFIAEALKSLAGTLNIPVYSALQANRSDAGTGVPVGEMNEKSVGGSDRLLQNASKLVFLADKTDEQIMLEGGALGNQQLRIAFQRNGACDCPVINIQFDREIIRMREIS